MEWAPCCCPPSVGVVLASPHPYDTLVARFSSRLRKGGMEIGMEEKEKEEAGGGEECGGEKSEVKEEEKR